MERVAIYGAVRIAFARVVKRELDRPGKMGKVGQAVAQGEVREVLSVENGKGVGFSIVAIYSGQP